MRCWKIGVIPRIPLPTPSLSAESDGVPAICGEAPADAWGVVARTAGVDGVEVFVDDTDEVCAFGVTLSSVSIVDVAAGLLVPAVINWLAPAMEEQSNRLTKPSEIAIY